MRQVVFNFNVINIGKLDKADIEFNKFTHCEVFLNKIIFKQYTEEELKGRDDTRYERYFDVFIHMFAGTEGYVHIPYTRVFKESLKARIHKAESARCNKIDPGMKFTVCLVCHEAVPKRARFCIWCGDERAVKKDLKATVADVVFNIKPPKGGF